MEQIGLERLTGLIAFVRAANHGSYTAAARALSISPSAISKSIQRLEKQLNVTLFFRTTRSLTLTPVGSTLYERASRLLQDMEDIEQIAFAARAEPSGMLRVTAPLPIGVHLLCPRLPEFRKRYPKLRIDLRLSDQFTNLAKDRIDVAIRVGDLNDSSLMSRQLAPNRLGAYASPDYLALRGIPEHPHDLASHDCVNIRIQSSGQQLRWTFTKDAQTIEITPEPKILVDTTDGVVAALAAGGGIGITPVYVAAPYVARGELVPVLPRYNMDRSHISALWQVSRRTNPAVNAFLTFLTETIT